MTHTDDLMRNNSAHLERLASAAPPNVRSARVALVTCMDTRIDPVAIFGLQPGDAHVLRNAGGVVTDDAIRSIVISQLVLGTDEVIVMQHTECGMLTPRDDEMKEQIEAHAGTQMPFSLETFTDLDMSVRESIARLEASPFVVKKDVLRGLVYDVLTGGLREVR